MRNIVIAVAIIAGLALMGLGAWYGWRLVAHGPISEAGFDAAIKNGKLQGPVRDAFIEGAVSACVKQRTANIDAEKFKQYCVCVAEKAADLITAEDAKAMDESDKISDSLTAKLQEPIQQCLKSSGLLPAQ